MIPKEWVVYSEYDDQLHVLKAYELWMYTDNENFTLLGEL